MRTNNIRIGMLMSIMLIIGCNNPESGKEGSEKKEALIKEYESKEHIIKYNYDVQLTFSDVPNSDGTLNLLDKNKNISFLIDTIDRKVISYSNRGVLEMELDYYQKSDLGELTEEKWYAVSKDSTEGLEAIRWTDGDKDTMLMIRNKSYKMKLY